MPAALRPLSPYIKSSSRGARNNNNMTSIKGSKVWPEFEERKPAPPRYCTCEAPRFYAPHTEGGECRWCWGIERPQPNNPYVTTIASRI